MSDVETMGLEADYMSENDQLHLSHATSVVGVDYGNGEDVTVEVIMQDGKTVSETVTKNGKAPKIKDLTKAEEERLYTAFVNAEKTQRFALLIAFEGKAYKVTKKDSFETYCHERLGLSYDAQRLSKIVKAAKVERALIGEAPTVSDLLAIEAKAPKEKKAKLSERTALEIAKLPETEWQAIYDEHNALIAGSHDKTAKELQQALGRIVSRTLKELNPYAPVKEKKAKKEKTPVQAAEPIKAYESNGPGSNMGGFTPVQAAVYDGSDEQQAFDRQQAIENGVSPEAANATLSSEYVALDDRLTTAESFIKTFTALMEGGELDVAALNELYNDCTEYQAKYGI